MEAWINTERVCAMMVPVHSLKTALLFLLGASFLILLGSSMNAAAECDPCFDVANGVMAMDDDGMADDAIFWAHFHEGGISNITIKVYHDNGTLFGQQKTSSGGEGDDHGNAFFANLTAGSYYWEAYDVQGAQLVDVGGFFDIIAESTIVYYAIIFDMDREYFPNDFIAAANDTSGGDADLWIEIYDDEGSLEYSGEMVENDEDWDDDMSHIFMQHNLTAGLYEYQIWSDEQHTTFYQNATFVICHLANCLNIDVNVMEFPGQGDGIPNDLIFMPRFGDENLDGITINLFDDEMRLVANGTSGDGPVIFYNVTDGEYYWNASVKDELVIWEGFWLLVDTENAYQHAAFLVAIEETGNDTWHDDFVAYLNISGESSTDAFVEVYDTTMTNQCPSGEISASCIGMFPKP